jgi:hypothetical protein
LAYFSDLAVVSFRFCGGDFKHNVGHAGLPGSGQSGGTSLSVHFMHRLVSFPDAPSLDFYPL